MQFQFKTNRIITGHGRRVVLLGDTVVVAVVDGGTVEVVVGDRVDVVVGGGVPVVGVVDRIVPVVGLVMVADVEVVVLFLFMTVILSIYLSASTTCFPEK